MFSLPSPSSSLLSSKNAIKNSKSKLQSDDNNNNNTNFSFIPGSSVLNVNYYYVCLLINDKDTSSTDYYIPNLVMKRITPV